MNINQWLSSVAVMNKVECNIYIYRYIYIKIF